MTSPVHVAVTYSYRCWVCGNTSDAVYCVFAHAEVPVPCTPHGWTNINGKLVGPNHTVKITVETADTKAIEEIPA